MSQDTPSIKAATEVDRRVGARIRARRLMLSMSQDSLAQALGLTFQQVQKYEKGKNRVGVSRLQQIATVLGVTPDFFFDEQETPGKAGASTLVDTDLAVSFMATREGARLVRVFANLTPEMRRRLVELAEAISASTTPVDANPVATADAAAP